MSNIDKQALREVAERATPGNWRRTSSLFNGITVTPFSLCGEEVTLAHTVEKRDAEFIAAANPATMLALLDENTQLQREKDAIEAVALALRDDMRQAREQLDEAESGFAPLTVERLIREREELEKRVAELERSETQLINERDAAESALADMYQAATGERPEWSNMFGFADAVDVVEERLATLEANQSQTTTPLASARGSEMTKILRKNYPRQSRFKEALFFLLFLILMVPISPIFFIWLAGVQAEKIAEWYSSIVWGPFNKLHNKLNPYRED